MDNDRQKLTIEWAAVWAMDGVGAPTRTTYIIIMRWGTIGLTSLSRKSRDRSPYERKGLCTRRLRRIGFDEIASSETQ